MTSEADQNQLWQPFKKKRNEVKKNSNVFLDSENQFSTNSYIKYSLN